MGHLRLRTQHTFYERVPYMPMASPAVVGTCPWPVAAFPADLEPLNLRVVLGDAGEL